MTADALDPTPAATLLDGIPSVAGNHNGGKLLVGHDGLLYVGVGDGGCYVRNPGQCAGGNPAARDLSVTSGKVLRVALDGSTPAGNPFVGAAGATSCRTGIAAPGQVCTEIYAYGLRNPFRIALDPNAPGTRIFVNDVGQDTWEEVDDLVAGGDYGWNVREGFCRNGSTTDCTPDPSYRDPIWAYGHGAGCESITAGAFVPAGAWPGYDGAYLFGDYICGALFALRPNGAGGWTQTTVSDDIGPITEAVFAADPGGPALYYLTYAGGGTLRRISRADAPAPTGTAAFTAVSPTRVLDTRDGTGSSAGKVAAAGSIRLVVPTAVVPADATSVALNVTLTEPSGPGFVRVWPGGEAPPETSNLNATAAGETVANLVVTRLGPGRTVDLYTQASAHLVVDVTGYWRPATAASAGRFRPIVPGRLADTREGLGVAAGVVPAGGSRRIQVLGRGGVPSSGVSAVALTVTATDAAAAGYVTVWPGGAARPYASTLNPTGRGDIRSNGALVPVGADGTVELFTYAATDLVVDVTGWFTDGSAPSSSTGLFQAEAPRRVLDTRTVGGPLGRTPRAVEAGPGAGAVAALVNVTATGTAAAGYVTAFPAGDATPFTSTVNFSGPGQTRAAGALVAVTGGTSLSLLGYANSSSATTTQVVLDRFGWFTA
jgi:hypothetical protein